MKINKDFKNVLLKRREILFVVESESNPGYEAVRKLLNEKVKAPEETVVIKFVKNNFGAHEFLVEAFVYESVEDKNNFEPRVKEKKKEGS